MMQISCISDSECQLPSHLKSRSFSSFLEMATVWELEEPPILIYLI